MNHVNDHERIGRAVKILAQAPLHFWKNQYGDRVVRDTLYAFDPAYGLVEVAIPGNGSLTFVCFIPYAEDLPPQRYLRRGEEEIARYKGKLTSPIVSSELSESEVNALERFSLDVKMQLTSWR